MLNVDKYIICFYNATANDRHATFPPLQPLEFPSFWTLQEILYYERHLSLKVTDGQKVLPRDHVTSTNRLYTLPNKSKDIAIKCGQRKKTLKRKHKDTLKLVLNIIYLCFDVIKYCKFKTLDIKLFLLYVYFKLHRESNYGNYGNTQEYKNPPFFLNENVTSSK